MDGRALTLKRFRLQALLRAGLSVPAGSDMAIVLVGVGIMITHNPLHRSQRAELPHWALTLDSDVQTEIGIRMHDARQRKPSVLPDGPCVRLSADAADSVDGGCGTTISVSGIETLQVCVHCMALHNTDSVQARRSATIGPPPGWDSAGAARVLL